MMKIALVSLLSMVAVAPAMATVTISSVDGSAPYGAPATFQFDSATPEYSGTIYYDSVGSLRAQPAGSTGGYGAVGPGDAEASAVLDLSSFGPIQSISFLWGSIDDFNTLDVLGTSAVFHGGDADLNPANGDQVAPGSNRLVTLTFSGDDIFNVTGLRFSATGNAFEFDNVNVTPAAVPEPASWALMLGGFALTGMALRGSRRSVTRTA